LINRFSILGKFFLSPIDPWQSREKSC